MQEEVFLNMSYHNKYLQKYATRDEEAIRLKPEKSDIRSPFFRDIDRIIYSYAFIRYSDKTQVFPGRKNDHITKRMLHVQYVSKIARTIGRALLLNEDLIESASLGHDLGHVPFGHFGESVLNQISLAHNEGYFNHNVESVRILMDLENKGEGRNITLQVLDAIMCHNGELELKEYRPSKKTKEQFLEEYQKTYTVKDFNKTLVPMTLEGCVVRVSDIIAYLGKDIEDARMLGLIKEEDIPLNIKNVLGVKNKEIVNTIVMDLIKNSLDKPYLKLSDDVFSAIVNLKKFNYEHIYNLSLSKDEKEKITYMYETLFATFLRDIKRGNKSSLIFTAFLDYKVEAYLNKTSAERKVIDFLAGMTDDYFCKCYEKVGGK